MGELRRCAKQSVNSRRAGQASVPAQSQRLVVGGRASALTSTGPAWSTTRIVGGQAAVATLAGVGIGIPGLTEAREAAAALAVMAREHDSTKLRLEQSEQRAQESAGRQSAAKRSNPT